MPYLYSCHDSESIEIIVCDSAQCNDDLSKLAADSINFSLKVNPFFSKFDRFFLGVVTKAFFIKKGSFDELNGYDNDLQIMEDFDLYKREKKLLTLILLLEKPLQFQLKIYR